jgi:hypothetical protein
MVHIIIKRSERELRERAYEAASEGFQQGRNIDGYARGLEEADNLLRSRGRDNPNQQPILVDDGGKAEKELRERTMRSMGIRPEAYQ